MLSGLDIVLVASSHSCSPSSLTGRRTETASLWVSCFRLVASALVLSWLFNLADMGPPADLSEGWVSFLARLSLILSPPSALLSGALTTFSAGREPESTLTALVRKLNSEVWGIFWQTPAHTRDRGVNADTRRVGLEDGARLEAAKLMLQVLCLRSKRSAVEGLLSLEFLKPPALSYTPLASRPNSS